VFTKLGITSRGELRNSVLETVDGGGE
jgi:hypothetical protein